MAQREESSRPAKRSAATTPPKRRFNPVLLALGAILVVVSLIIWNSDIVRSPERPAPSDLEQVRTMIQKDIKEGLDEAARNLMLSYVQRNPNDLEIRPMLARTQRKLGDNAGAELTVDDMLRLSPQLPEALWLKGELVRARVQTKEGEAEAMKRFRNAAESPMAVANPTVGGDIWVRYGLELLDAGQLDEAEKYLKKSQDAGLDDARLAKGFGVLAFGRKQYPQAAVQLAQALKDQELSSDARLWRMLASSLREQGQADAALAAIQEGLTKCRDKAGLYMQLGELEAAAGHPDKAAAAYAEATRFREVRQAAALQAAVNFYATGQYSQALYYIDTAESLGASDAISEWKVKIETAHGFGYRLTTQPAQP